MKLVSIFGALLIGLSVSVLAAEKPEVGDPTDDLASMVGCAAGGLALYHHDIDVASSISSLSADHATPQLTMLITSYKSMAEDERHRVDSYMEVISGSIMPVLAQGDMVGVLRQRVFQLLSQTSAKLAVALGNPMHTIEDQTQMHKKLSDQSSNCETLAVAIREHYSNKPLEN